jgi:hypothetical protein
MAFAAKMAETRLAGLKAVEPKLQAFYDSLDAKQKKDWRANRRHIRLVGQEVKAQLQRRSTALGCAEFVPSRT